MNYALNLKPSDQLALPRQDVRALLSAGDGAAALLYLQLAEGGEMSAQALCRTLHWSAGALSAAEETLTRLGLLGERREVQETAPSAPERACPAYSRADLLQALEGGGEFAALRRAVGEKLNKVLTEKDDAILLGLYDYLGLPADVIFLLTGHCIQRAERRYGEHRRPTLRQIEKEGYRWARLGLMTQELAVEYLKEYARKQTMLPSMMAALRLGGREPVARELEFLERWMEWGFSDEAVAQAYEQTVFKCGKFEWRYCNGILRDWDKKGLHTPEEIAAGDKPPRAARTQDRPARRGASQEDQEQAREKERAAAVQESVAWMKEYLKETEEP